MPSNWSSATAVVESILGTRGTVEVDDDLDVSLLCPIDRFQQIGILTSRIGLGAVLYARDGPIALGRCIFSAELVEDGSRLTIGILTVLRPAALIRSKLFAVMN